MFYSSVFFVNKTSLCESGFFSVPFSPLFLALCISVMSICMFPIVCLFVSFSFLLSFRVLVFLSVSLFLSLFYGQFVFVINM